MKKFYVYILCSKRNGTLYTGITSNLIKRVYEHKNNLANGFTHKYNVHRLVWFEEGSPFSRGHVCMRTFVNENWIPAQKTAGMTNDQE